MLIEFSVQNYRSFGERQTLSLVAGAKSAKNEDVALSTGSRAVPHVLRGACLFGANGSGKSALVNAMSFMRKFVENSSKDYQENDPIDVIPFAYDPEWADSPSEFEIIFLHNESVFQYGFAADKTRVWDEWLFERPNETGKERKILTSTYVEETGEYERYINPTSVKGQRESWKAQTRKNALMLSAAVQLNAEDLFGPYRWIVEYFRLLENPQSLQDSFTVQKMEEGWKDDILGLLKSIDIGLDDIKADIRDFHERDIPEGTKEEIRKRIIKEMTNKKVIDNVATYRADTSGKLIELSMDEESSGTQFLFALAGPILDVLECGYTLIIDEPNNNLHPLALRHLVGLFMCPNANKHGAQLIFTSHDTSILDGECLDKDQVWLVEKSKEFYSTLVPLSDFDLRDVKRVQKYYLDGRFGGIPHIKDFISDTVAAE